MFFKNWGKVFVLFVLLCVLFCSCSFAADLEDGSTFLVADDLDGDAFEVDVGSSSYLSDSPSLPFVDDDNDVDSNSSILVVDVDTVFNDEDSCVDNWADDFRDDDLDLEPNINPRLDPSDNRTVSILEINSFSKYYRNGTQLVGYLKDADGNPLAGRNVYVGIVGVFYNRTTDEDGMFYLNINLYPNNYTSNIIFEGDSDYQPCSKTISVKVFTMPTTLVASNLVKYYRNGSQLYACLLDVHGNPLVDKIISFKFDNTTYNCTTNSSGYARLTINLSPRVTNFTIRFSSSGYNSSKKIVTVTVLVMPTCIESSDLVKHYRDGNQWVARLLDVHGNPLVGKSLIFKIGNVNYTRITDDWGYAVLIINLSPRNASYTVRFKENYYYNVSRTVNINVLYPPAPTYNWKSGFYNCSSLFVNISAYHNDAHIYCSFDNGISWSGTYGDMGFNLCEGNWSILSFVILDGYHSSNISYDYEIGDFNSYVWMNKGSGIYNDSFDLIFNCHNPYSDYNINPTIFYTLDGSDPTFGSSVYSNPIHISDQSNRTVLKYFIRDVHGVCSDVTTVYYFFGDLVANFNNGKIYDSVQEAVDDNETVDGDIIGVSSDIFGSVILDKGVCLRACRFKPVYWYGVSDEPIVNILCDNVVVDGFNFTGSNVFNLRFANNCSILNNYALIQHGYIVRLFYCSFCNISGNYFLANMSNVTGVNSIASSFCNMVYNTIIICPPSDYLDFSKLDSDNQVVFSTSNVSVACLSSKFGCLADREVLVKIDGEDFVVHTDSFGDVYLPINLSSGLHTVIFYFKGDEYYLSSYNSSRIYVINDSSDICLSVSEGSGFYDSSSLLVNFSSCLDDVVVFCSFDNGSTWSSYDGDVCYNLSEGVWDVLAYCSLYGFNSSVYNFSFVVGNSSPLVWVSNGSGIYNESFEVDLSAFSSIDDDVLIYYTLDGSLPTCDGLLYNGSFIISNQSSFTNLSFFAVDSFGHFSDVVSVYYFFGDCIVNLNNGKIFSCMQDAIFDGDTFDGDVIEASMDLNEFVIVNKSVVLRSCDFRNVLWTSASYEMICLDNVSDVVIEGFTFYQDYDGGIVIDFSGSFNCVVVDNFFLNDFGVSLFDGVYSYNNSVLFNNFYSVLGNPISLCNVENYSFIGNGFNVIDCADELVSILINGDLGFGCAISLDCCTNSIFYDNVFFNGSVGIGIGGGIP